MQWLRLHHDTPDDQKWRLVSVRSGQPVGNILAVWMMMMISASKSEERGTLTDWNDEIAAAVLGYSPDVVSKIRSAMQGLVLEDISLTGWAKRQRQGTDDAAERKRRSRAAQQGKTPPDDDGNGGNHAKSGETGTILNGHAPVTGQSRDIEAMSRDMSDSSRDGHAPVTGGSSRAKTPDYKKEEDSEAKASGPQADPKLPLKALLFGECLRWLCASVPERPATQLRKMIGRWCGQYGEGAVLEAFTIAQRDAAVSPVGYIEKILKTRSASNVHPFRSATQQHRQPAGRATGGVAAGRVLAGILAKGD